MSLLVAETGSKTDVRMSQILTGAAPSRFAAVLGSCVGLVLYDPRARVGSLAHIVLPASEGRTGPPGKFADTALPQMLAELERHGAARRRLQAKIYGGANMFNSTRPFQIGEVNLQAVAVLLAAAAIPVADRHVAGNHGRRICFDTATGLVSVETAGQRPAEI